MLYSLKYGGPGLAMGHSQKKKFGRENLAILLRIALIACRPHTLIVLPSLHCPHCPPYIAQGISISASLPDIRTLSEELHLFLNCLPLQLATFV